MAAPDGGLGTRLRLGRVPMGRVLEWGASLLCVVFLVLWFKDQPLPDLFATPERAAWVLAAVCFFLAAMCLAGERWHYLLRRQASASARGTAYRSIGLAEVVNMLLPMRAGDAVRIGIVCERERRPISGCVGVLAVERGLGLTTQLVLLGLTGALVLSQVPAIFRNTWAAGAAVLLLAAGAAAIGWGSVALGRAVVRLAPRPAIATLAEPFAQLTPVAAMIGAALSAAIFCGEGLAWWAAARSAGLGLPLLEALFIQALATLAMIVPAGPGSVGTLDAAIALALGSVGWSADESLGFIVTLRVAMLTSCVSFWLCVSSGDLLRQARSAW